MSKAFSKETDDGPPPVVEAIISPPPFFKSRVLRQRFGGDSESLSLPAL